MSISQVIVDLAHFVQFKLKKKKKSSVTKTKKAVLWFQSIKTFWVAGFCRSEQVVMHLIDLTSTEEKAELEEIIGLKVII